MSHYFSAQLSHLILIFSFNQLTTCTAYFAPLIVSHTMDPLLEPNRKRGSKSYQLKFYKEPTKRYSYVKYSSTPLGGVSATQSSIQTTVTGGSEENVTPGVAGPDEDNDWIGAGDSEPPLEQAYLDHISDKVIDERLKRERPKGVSFKVCTILKS